MVANGVCAEPPPLNVCDYRCFGGFGSMFCVCGFVVWDKFREATTARTPVRRWGEPDDMVPAAIFLSDPDAIYHTGQNIVVDGGYTVF